MSSERGVKGNGWWRVQTGMWTGGTRRRCHNVEISPYYMYISQRAAGLVGADLVYVDTYIGHMQITPCNYQTYIRSTKGIRR